MSSAEALRQFQFRVSVSCTENFCLIHVSLVPVIGEQGHFSGGRWPMRIWGFLCIWAMADDAMAEAEARARTAMAEAEGARTAMAELGLQKSYPWSINRLWQRDQEHKPT